MNSRIHIRTIHARGAAHAVPGYWCPVCGHPHFIAVGQPLREKGPTWTWNGSHERPTFKPSVLTYYTKPAGSYWLLKREGKYLCVPGTTRPLEFGDAGMAARWADDHKADNGGTGWGVVARRREGEVRHTVCHVHVTDGKIQILSDTPGPLGGTTLPLLEWDMEVYDKTGKRVGGE